MAADLPRHGNKLVHVPAKIFWQHHTSTSVMYGNMQNNLCLFRRCSTRKRLVRFQIISSLFVLPFSARHLVEGRAIRRRLGASAKFRHALEAQIGAHGLSDKVPVKGKGLDLLAAQTLRGSGAQDLGHFETQRAAEQTDLADLLVVPVRHETDTQWRGVHGKAGLVHEAQTLVVALATDDNVVQIHGLIAADASGEHAMVRHGTGGVDTFFFNNRKMKLCGTPLSRIQTKSVYGTMLCTRPVSRRLVVMSPKRTRACFHRKILVYNVYVGAMVVRKE